MAIRECGMDCNAHAQSSGACCLSPRRWASENAGKFFINHPVFKPIFLSTRGLAYLEWGVLEQHIFCSNTEK